MIAEIETDKASVTIEAQADGFLLGYVPPVGEMIPVGATLAWLGSSRDEAIPEAATAPGCRRRGAAAPPENRR